MSYAKISAFVIALGLGIGTSELTNSLAWPEVVEPVHVTPTRIELPKAESIPVQPADLQGSGCGESGGGQGLKQGWGTGAGDGIAAGSGSGYSSGSGTSTLWSDSPPPASRRVTSPLKVLFKKKPQYTEEARTRGIQGTVTLRVTFLASGGIGSITTVRGLPCGLTEQAISAAREMKFEPEKVDGVPRTTARPVSFTFNIY